MTTAMVRRPLGLHCTLDTSVANDNSTFAYASRTGPGAGYSFVIAAGGPNDQYKLFLKKSDYSTPWYVLAENIVGIKIWLEGEASDLH